MPQLLLKHSDLSSATAGSLEVGLSGYVPEKLIDEIDKELSLVRATFHDLEASLPPMRIEQGFWQFSASCPQIYFSEIFIQCFLDALKQSASVYFEGLASKFREGVHSFRISRKRRTAHQTIRLRAKKWAAVARDRGESPRCADPAARHDLPPRRAEMPVIFGAGWDAGRNKTYEMIHGTTAAPDLDLECTS